VRRWELSRVSLLLRLLYSNAECEALGEKRSSSHTLSVSSMPNVYNGFTLGLAAAARVQWNLLRVGGPFSVRAKGMRFGQSVGVSCAACCTFRRHRRRAWCGLSVLVRLYTGQNSLHPRITLFCFIELLLLLYAVVWFIDMAFVKPTKACKGGRWLIKSWLEKFLIRAYIKFYNSWRIGLGPPAALEINF
jgi:hypothetical protein